VLAIRSDSVSRFAPSASCVAKHPHASDFRRSTPRAVASVRIILSRSINAYPAQASRIAGLLAFGAPCAGVIILAFSASPVKRLISREARAAMMQMGQTPRGKQFSFQASTLRVYADTHGRFLHIGHALKVVVRRPDRLRVDIDGDDGVTHLFYDGKTLVQYSPAKKEYFSIPVPHTIDGMPKSSSNCRISRRKKSLRSSYSMASSSHRSSVAS
jgi:Predicted periplasmic protein (DUF2092)